MTSEAGVITNRRLILPYAGPFLAYVLIASALGDHTSFEVNYILRLVATLGILIWAWKWYFPIKGPGSPLVSVAVGVGAGLIGLILWVALLMPFVSPEDSEPWSTTGFTLRLIAAGLLVPVFEELLMRGFIFRLALQWDEARKKKDEEPLQTALDERTVDDVVPGAWSWAAVIISTIVFASGHNVSEWPASIGYGLLMSLLWIVRKDLLTCIAAHSMTNICLALYVLKTESWHLW